MPCVEEAQFILLLVFRNGESVCRVDQQIRKGETEKATLCCRRAVYSVMLLPFSHGWSSCKEENRMGSEQQQI